MPFAVYICIYIIEILKKQKQLEQNEINLEWRYVFGPIKPKKKEICILTNVTLRNIWMNHLFIFEQIKAQRPDENFHSPDKYVLTYHPPNSPFAMLISLTDKNLQEDAIRRIDRLRSNEKKKLLFHFIPLEDGMPMFGPKVHPASLVQYKTKPEVLAKLCDLYLSGHAGLKDFSGALDGGFDVWKQTVYNLLPEDEQEYHRYLQIPAKKSVVKSKERMYMDDDIDLQEYEDLKFPERKKKRDAEALTYPQPYATGNCIIDGSSDGVIKCLNCPNLICRSCIIREFLSNNVAAGSFMLVHRRFCMRFGQVPIVEVNVEPPPGYLTELRITGKQAAESMLFTVEEEEVVDMDDQDQHDTDTDADTIDVEKLRKEEERRRVAEATADFIKLMQKTQARFEKHFTEFVNLQEIIDDKSRAEKYRERTARLKNEAVVHYQKVIPKREPVDKSYADLDPQVHLIDKSIAERYSRFCLVLDQIDRLLSSENIESFRMEESRILEVAELRKKRELEERIGIS